MKQLKNKIEDAVILTEGQAKGLISEPFDELRQEFADQYQTEGIGTAPHAFFKRIPNTARLAQKVAIINQGLSNDETVKALLTRPTKAEDAYNQALTNYLAGKAEQIQDKDDE